MTTDTGIPDFPQTLPPGTVVGRLPTGGAGATQAIPFSVLITNLNASPGIANLLLQDGGVGAPSYSFFNEPTSGIYRAGAGNVAISILGTLNVSFSATAISPNVPIRNQDGTLAAPSYSFGTETGTGLYRASAGTIGVAVGGATVANVTAGGLFMGANTAVVTQDGTAGAPSFTYAVDTDTGFYRVGANQIGITAGGANVASFSTGGLTVAGTGTAIFALQGTNSLPTYSFNGDSNTGMYSSGADAIDWTVGGVRAATLNSSGLTIGLTGTTTGTINLSGSGSGLVSIKTQAAAGTYNWNLPITAGSTSNMLMSGGGGASPMTWSTNTWPSTAAASSLLYANGANTIAALATANGGVLNTSSSGVPSITPNPVIGVKATTSGSISLQSDTGAGSLGNMSLSAGVGAAASPSIAFFGSTSGQVNVQVAAAAGSWTFKWPTTAGTALQFMQTDGSGNATWASTRSIMTFTNGTVSQVQNVSAFQVTISTTTENLAQFVIPYACTIKNLYAVSTAPAAGQTCIFMVRKNSADTTLTCTVTGAGTTSNDTTHSVTFAAGDLIGIKTTTSATSGTMLLMQCSVEVDSP